MWRGGAGRGGGGCALLPAGAPGCAQRAGAPGIFLSRSGGVSRGAVPLRPPSHRHTAATAATTATTQHTVTLETITPSDCVVQ